MAISIGDAVLKVGVDKRDFDQKMSGIGASIKKHHKAIGTGMVVMGAAILAAGAMSVKQFARMGDEVQKMALRTGFSTEALSEFRHAAELSGASLAGLEKASRTLSGVILDAGYGLESYTRAFDKIGLSYEKLAELKPEDQFIAVMEALAGVESESERAALATDLFGRAGTQLLPMLADGAEGLATMRQEAHDLGIVFDLEAANKAAAFNDALTKLKGSMSGVMITIGSFLVDALKPLIDKVTALIEKFSDWSKEHPTLSRVITYTAMAIGGLLLVGGSLLIMLPQLTAAYAIMSGFILTKLIPTIIALTTALWAKVAALYAVMVALGPAGWAMAGIAAGLIISGLILLNKHHTAELKKVTEATEKATGATRELNLELEKATGTTTGFSTANDVLVRSINRVTNALHLEGAEIDTVTGKTISYINWMSKKYPELSMITLAAVARRWVTAPGEPVPIIHPGLLPSFEAGGIVTGPTLARLGEKGPEAVVPLDRVGGYKTANIYVMLDGTLLGRVIRQDLVDDLGLRAGLQI